MTSSQMKFVGLIVEGKAPADAYVESGGKSRTPADAAAALLRREDVRSAIMERREAMRRDSLDLGSWSLRASDLARLADLAAIEAEIARRREGIDLILGGLAADESLSPAERMVARGEAMQRRVVTADLLRVKQDIYDALDRRMAEMGVEDGDCIAARLLRLSAQGLDGIDVDSYTAPIPATALLARTSKDSDKSSDSIG